VLSSGGSIHREEYITVRGADQMGALYLHARQNGRIMEASEIKESGGG
jgi:hypothetical protein